MVKKPKARKARSPLVRPVHKHIDRKKELKKRGHQESMT